MAEAGTWAGIDLGTSSVKAVLIDGPERIVATAEAPLTVSRPKPGWSEQDPAHWIAAAEAALDALAAERPREMAALRGIGLSGQQHGATLVGADGAALRPCLLWNDARSGAECVELEARADFRGLCGSILMPGFTAPKTEWVRKHEPAVWDRIKAVLLPKDFLRLWLTGEKVSDLSDSSGTGWLDVANRRWSPELLAASGLTEAQMPRLVEGSEPGGALRPELCARWGIAGRPVVAGGGGDNPAAACGVGAVTDGEGFLTIGTSGVLFVANAAFSPNIPAAVHAFCHAVPGMWHQMAVILSAADSLSWLSRITGRDAGALAAMVDEAREPPERLFFHPYLSGERTPHADPNARGHITGLSHGVEVADLAQAVFEGVAFAFADGAEALRAGGAAMGELVAVGGGARSDAWLRIIADAAGLALGRPADEKSGGALGAARLGLCAAEGAAPAEACPKPRIVWRCEPDPARRAMRLEALARWRETYAAIAAVRRR